MYKRQQQSLEYLALRHRQSLGKTDALDHPVQSVWNCIAAVSYTHLRAHETVLDIVCRLLLEKKKTTRNNTHIVQHLSTV